MREGGDMGSALLGGGVAKAPLFIEAKADPQWACHQWQKVEYLQNTVVESLLLIAELCRKL